MRAVIEGLQALRGIALTSAVTIVAEVGELSRFARAPQLMGDGGLGAREDSSGPRTRRGGITKTGNAHLRRILVESGVALSPSSLHWQGAAPTTSRGTGDRACPRENYAITTPVANSRS